jgi:cytochrome c553
VIPLSTLTAEQIETTMQAFRSGSRPSTVMDRIAKGFSDEEVRAIAKWFASDQAK